MRRSSSPYASSFSFGPGPLSTALKALIGANVAMFVAQRFLPASVRITSAWVIRMSRVLRARFWVWQLGTYMFLHGGMFHILFNMLALWMFGAELERIWGTRYFLKFYFVTGIGAGAADGDVLAAAVRFAQQLQQSMIIGASARSTACCSPTRCISRIGRSTCIRVPDAGEDLRRDHRRRLRSFRR